MTGISRSSQCTLMELVDVDRTEVRVAACIEIDMEMDPQYA